MQNKLWLDNIKMPEFEMLKSDIKTDVLIVGGGIAGILTAYFLTKSGIDCVLVEKNKLCSGVSSGTTGKITSQHGLIYSDLIKKFGVELAKGYLESNNLAVDTYKNLCKNIDCDFEIKDNYVFSLNNYKLSSEMDAFGKIGFKAEFTFLKNLPVANFGAVKFAEQAQFHPIKFLSEIAKGLKIFENTFVLKFDGNKAITSHGNIIAENIVIATHFPFIDSHGSYYLKLYQYRSYAIALDKANDINGMYVSDRKDGLSFRNYKDMLIIIGGSHRTGKKGGSFTEIEQFARIHYPQSRILYRWATQDCMSLDSVPYIGKYYGNTSNMYVLTGFNKWGMTGSMTGAIIINDMILGKDNKFKELYSPSRTILRNQLLVNGFESITNLLNPFGKRCPHLGCKLKWNKIERSWDCPCHGSRFNSDGKVLDNPANGDIK